MSTITKATMLLSENELSEIYQKYEDEPKDTERNHILQNKSGILKEGKTICLTFEIVLRPMRTQI